jgi:hypothetical protein
MTDGNSFTYKRASAVNELPVPVPVDDEQMILWQDTLDEIMAGRRSGLLCPSCKKGQLLIEDQPRGMRISCPACKKFIEGSMDPSEI